jgi:hypothetical protein
MVLIRRHARHWVAYVAGGGLVLILSLIGRHSKKVKGKSDPAPEQSNSKIASEEVRQRRKHSPSHRYRHYRHPSEDEHRTFEQLVWVGSFFLALLTAIATLTAASFAIGAYNASWQAVRAAQEQTFIAKGALISSNRPWIKVTDLKVARLEVTPDYVSLTTHISVKNVGASPAARTFIKTELLPSGSIGDESLEAENFCKQYLLNPVRAQTVLTRSSGRSDRRRCRAVRRCRQWSGSLQTNPCPRWIESRR